MSFKTAKSDVQLTFSKLEALLKVSGYSEFTMQECLVNFLK